MKARVQYAIVLVSDMARSVRFYRDALELPLRFESPHWTEFDTEGATLALHLAPGPAVASTGEGPGSCRPGFSVPDLDAFHSRMIAQQVQCMQEPRVTFGARIAQYVDPDGLVLAVSERR